MPTYEFLLFVSTQNTTDQRVIAGLKSFCERHLNGEYSLTVVDVRREPDEAERHRILATPTLIKCSPLPEQRLVGSVWQSDRLLAAFGLPAPGNSGLDEPRDSTAQFDTR